MVLINGIVLLQLGYNPNRNNIKICTSHPDTTTVFPEYRNTIKAIQSCRLKSLKKDIDSGLYFKSNIPISSGLGSSGALVSSILINYANTDLRKKNSNEIKKIMSIMESKFHLKSSGFDPLVSFFNKPILMSDGNVELIEDIKFRDFKIYLVDSKIPSSTSDMITIFNQKMNDEMGNSWIQTQNSRSVHVRSSLESVLEL